MAGRREVSFEVHVLQGETWSIQARYPAAKGKIAIEEAQSFGQYGYKSAVLDLSRFSAAPGAHLSGDLFKSQGAFPA